jgi:RNA polymerase sigma factor (sigma-70 family)
MRLHSRQLIDDIRQETLMRVLETLRQKQGVVHPERFGAFVNAVCNNVMMELGRAETRHDPLNGDQKEPPDCRIDLDAPLIDAEIKRHIERVLNELPASDRCLLRAVYLDEVDRSEVCRLHGVDGDYLRVLLHRAKTRFRKVCRQNGSQLVTSHAA